MGFNKGWKDHLCMLSWLLLLPLTAGQEPPYALPDLNLGNLPDTSFSCEGKVVGGYYADFETNCQMFHVCTLGQKGETQDIKFLCLQGTVFDQKTRVCERSEEVLCSNGADIYDVNRELYHHSNKHQQEFAGNVTDSTGDASEAHAFLPLDSDYQDSGRYPASDYTYDYGTDCAGYRGCTRTRSEVPPFRPPVREQRAQQQLPKQPAFSRFRQTRPFNSVSTTTPSTTTAHLAALESVTVPIIPVVNDPDRPRVVVTNGKPFVPKLDASDLGAHAHPGGGISFAGAAGYKLLLRRQSQRGALRRPGDGLQDVPHLRDRPGRHDNRLQIFVRKQHSVRAEVKNLPRNRENRLRLICTQLLRQQSFDHSHVEVNRKQNAKDQTTGIHSL
ncbi:uncharacterized protein LOC119107643 isoform X2 [Pollicipes pollicipes]|uniref:uncharacterized protein LOC119107643 isoform X2 n=1 Tax=Pollicipes pollicipes TaxID=41117 RepID=UPI001885710D|nr:uncharacterized protein LOC119107643 isoform X2 [Pollicipes pollicipes]XP_037087051.1 uncharacterized protein LOC119107643 isoform X2 [Pollicipes pollicipes]